MGVDEGGHFEAIQRGWRTPEISRRYHVVSLRLQNVNPEPVPFFLKVKVFVELTYASCSSQLRNMITNLAKNGV